MVEVASALTVHKVILAGTFPLAGTRKLKADIMTRRADGT
jgi:hypothetical protein